MNGSFLALELPGRHSYDFRTFDPSTRQLLPRNFNSIFKQNIPPFTQTRLSKPLPTPSSTSTKHQLQTFSADPYTNGTAPCLDHVPFVFCKAERCGKNGFTCGGLLLSTLLSQWCVFAPLCCNGPRGWLGDSPRRRCLSTPPPWPVPSFLYDVGSPFAGLLSGFFFMIWFAPPHHGSFSFRGVKTLAWSEGREGRESF